MKPINSDAICDQLYQLCVDHQTYLEEQLHNALNRGFGIGYFSIGYEYNEHAVEQLYNGQMMIKPTKLILYVWDNHMYENKKQKLQQITRNYNVIEKLRCSLTDNSSYLVRESHQKLIDFNALFSSFEAGVLLSLRSKNSFAFWKSQGEITVDEMERLLESVNDASNHNQIL